KKKKKKKKRKRVSRQLTGVGSRADLLGLLLDVNDSSTPVVDVRPHELIDLGQELVPDHRGAHEAKHTTPHGLVHVTTYGCNVGPPQDIQHGLRVARDKPFAFVHQNEPVELWIHAHHRRTSQYMRLEQTPVPTEARRFMSTFLGIQAGEQNRGVLSGNRLYQNSVVSPKTGQPIVPGGRPFFLYLTSFHLNTAPQVTRRLTANPITIAKTTISATREQLLTRMESA
ncbi:hypothetical protein GW17_00050486, partial [Ensete ventricosum]